MRSTVLAVSAAAVALAGLIFYREYRRPPAVPRSLPCNTEISPAPPESLVIAHRTRAKLALAKRAIAERLPLLEVAETFRQLNGEDGMIALRSVSGRSVREKLCRQVILYVAGIEQDLESAGQGTTGPLVSAELVEELDRRIAAGEFPPEPGVE